MTDKLVIALAQMTQSVGDLAANADAMLQWRERAREADLIVFPELQLIGYPPEDLVLKPALVERANQELDRLAQATADGGPAMLVGTVVASQGVLFNVVALLENGAVTAIRQKRELPNYGTFDEKRLFAPGPLPAPIDFKGVKIGVPVCEDIWFPFVTAHLRAEGAELLISPNGSPFEIDKDDRRINAVAGTRVRETGLPLIYVNRVGGQDELAFDGASFVMGADLSIAHQLPDWEEALVLTQWEKWDGQWVCMPGERHALDERPADIYNAMVIALRDYVDRNRFPGVVLGLSGGIDSALSAAVAVDALGADRVWCVMMPSRFTSQDSLDDAVECSRLLGVRYDIIPIEAGATAFDAMLGDVFAERQRDLTEENIQSRIRGVLLMALSNKFGHMLLTTGNKSVM